MFFVYELKQNQCNEENAESKSFELFKNDGSLLTCSVDTTFFSTDAKGNIRIYEANQTKQNTCVKAENNIGFEIYESYKVEHIVNDN